MLSPRFAHEFPAIRSRSAPPEGSDHRDASHRRIARRPGCSRAQGGQSYCRAGTLPQPVSLLHFPRRTSQIVFRSSWISKPVRGQGGAVVFEGKTPVESDHPYRVVVIKEHNELVITFSVSGGTGMGLAREFFEAPLFTPSETQRLCAMIDHAERSAFRATGPVRDSHEIAGLFRRPPLDGALSAVAAVGFRRVRFHRSELARRWPSLEKLDERRPRLTEGCCYSNRCGSGSPHARSSPGYHWSRKHGPGSCRIGHGSERSPDAGWLRSATRTASCSNAIRARGRFSKAPS